MIERYGRPEMVNLWSEEAQYRTWLDVEILACEAWGKLGKIPVEALKVIREKATFEIDKIREKEAVTKHDVAAFVSEVQSHLGDAGRYFHFGLTSSDVLDTAFSYRLKKSSELIQLSLKECLRVTGKRALTEKHVPMMGRTHGIHAEPITMGLKWLLWHDMLHRSLSRIQLATKELAVGKLSGAVGTHSHTPPEVESYVCEKLGLEPVSCATQVVPRDRYAGYFSSLALLGSCIEAIATEIRHLQRTEVSEVREGFSKGQKGSSAMPHKRNPITAENLTGLARLLRSMVVPAMENCALWHERDISHSSVERVIGPDANILAHFMSARLLGLLEGLETFPDRMMQNLESLHGVIYSQDVLLALIEAGASRDRAYEIVQKNALLAIDSKSSFKSLLDKDADVQKLISKAKLDKLFDLNRCYEYLDSVYKKVLE